LFREFVWQELYFFFVLLLSGKNGEDFSEAEILVLTLAVPCGFCGSINLFPVLEMAVHVWKIRKKCWLLDQEEIIPEFNECGFH